MEKVVGEVFLIISLILGTGISVKTLHDKMRRLTIETIMKGQPSLSSFTHKLTGQKGGF